jgi:hypothetical protein
MLTAPPSVDRMETDERSTSASMMSSTPTAPFFSLTTRYNDRCYSFDCSAECQQQQQQLPTAASINTTSHIPDDCLLVHVLDQVSEMTMTDATSPLNNSSNNNNNSNSTTTPACHHFYYNTPVVARPPNCPWAAALELKQQQQQQQQHQHDEPTLFLQRQPTPSTSSGARQNLCTHNEIAARTAPQLPSSPDLSAATAKLQHDQHAHHHRHNAIAIAPQFSPLYRFQQVPSHIFLQQQQQHHQHHQQRNHHLRFRALSRSPLLEDEASPLMTSMMPFGNMSHLPNSSSSSSSVHGNNMIVAAHRAPPPTPIVRAASSSSSSSTAASTTAPPLLPYIGSPDQHSRSIFSTSTPRVLKMRAAGRKAVVPFLQE